MRRIKVILAVVAAVATMTMLAAPAMAQDGVEISSGDVGVDDLGFCAGLCGVFSGSGGFDDSGLFSSDNGGRDFTLSGPGTIVGGNGGGSFEGNGISFG